MTKRPRSASLRGLGLAILFGTLSVAPVRAAPASFEANMLQLAEILGALNYLRPLCGADDGADWRAKMYELMTAQAHHEGSREKLAGAFNTGYRAYQTTYRSCTPSARLAIQRYLSEGARLARDIAARHGN